MKKWLKRLWENEKGFTLIELIIVIAILAIIAAVAIPNILTAVDNSRKTTDITNAKMIADAAAIIKAKNDTYSSEAGVYTFTSSAAPVASGTGTAGFATLLSDQLNDAMIGPKYKGGNAAGATAFVMTIAADGTITIAVDATADQAIFPVPAATYNLN